MDHTISFVDQLKQHLQSLRKSRGLTQKSLAQKLDVVQSRVAQLEANPGVMTLDSFFKLLNALDVQLVLRDKNPDIQRDVSALSTPSQVRTHPDRKSTSEGEW